MSVRTRVDRALARVRAERAAVDGRVDAIEAFVRRIGDLPGESGASSGRPVAAGTGPRFARGGATGGDRCETVRTAFAETIGARDGVDVGDTDALVESVRSELSAAVAVAVAPTTDASLSPALVRATVTAAATRRAEAETLRRALDREADRLDAAAGTVRDALGWLADADEIRLLGVSFDALRRRHETLARHRERCEELVARRQAFLRGTTEGDAGVEIGHRRLVTSLYESFPAEHPLLATVVEVDAACGERQRAVRDQLTRRV